MDRILSEIQEGSLRDPFWWTKLRSSRRGKPWWWNERHLWQLALKFRYLAVDPVISGRSGLGKHELDWGEVHDFNSYYSVIIKQKENAAKHLHLKRILLLILLTDSWIPSWNCYSSKKKMLKVNNVCGNSWKNCIGFDGDCVKDWKAERKPPDDVARSLLLLLQGWADESWCGARQQWRRVVTHGPSQQDVQVERISEGGTQR